MISQKQRKTTLRSPMPLPMVRLCLVALCLLPLGCNSRPQPAAKPMVVTSVTAQAYFVRRIAGNTVDVHIMVPPGANPSAYEPTMEQMKALARAALFVKIGHPHFPFEKAWLHKLLAGRPDLSVVDSSQGIPLDEEDPHIWVSVKNAELITKNIFDKLAKIAPENKALYKENLDKFLQDTSALDREIRSLLADVPRRTFYVFHPAWHTFASDYGLKQVAIEHDHKEPSPRELQNVINQAKADGTKTIFVQPQISKESADLVAREIGGEVVIINPLGEDWLESMRIAARAIAKALSQ